MGPLKHLVLQVILASTIVYAYPSQKKEKSIGIFNIVQFPNDVCASDSSTMNGTCYTSEECSSRNGVASGSCADGYGICCIISLSCGGSTTDNCTYLTQTTFETTGCSFEICPRDTSINRIRLDLNTFQIAGPYMTGDVDGTATNTQTADGSQIGRCIQDSFTVTGAPTICGLNTGQHMIVDTDGSTCVDATFVYTGTSTRSYNIHVTQYSSTNEMGGPPGCLQYFTGDTGTVTSFNWDFQATATRANNPGTHLQSQNYNVCVRQNSAKCIICWHATIAGEAAIRGTFGLSVSPDAAAKSAAGATCSEDYVVIAGGTDGLTAAPANVAALNGGNVNGASADKYCGRYFNEHNQADSQTTCTRTTPFTLGVVTDDKETVGAHALTTNELSAANDGEAFGTQGFSLGFAQVGC